MDSPSQSRRTTVLDLQAAKERGQRWAMLTAYDAMTATVFEQSGVRVLLVGDSASMVVYGHSTTVPVTLDELIPLAAGVVRGTSLALVVGDLPFGSYQASVEGAVVAATRYMKEAGTHAVKLEGGMAVLPQVAALSSSGIPVMGHLGLTPQSVHALGGMQRVQGRGEAGEQLLLEAKALQDAGAFALVLEAVPAELAQRVTQQLHIPVIGIGAGAATDAQVLVWQDMAGLTPGHLPKFVKQFGDLRSALGDATRSYVEEVESGTYPDDAHSYK